MPTINNNLQCIQFNSKLKYFINNKGKLNISMKTFQDEILIVSIFLIFMVFLDLGVIKCFSFFPSETLL